MAMKDDIADGFATIEVHYTTVKTLKINQRQFDNLKREDIQGVNVINMMIWGADIQIEEKLKEPVVIGENGLIATLKDDKWVITENR